jgi:hypothetical protein
VNRARKKGKDFCAPINSISASQSQPQSDTQPQSQLQSQAQTQVQTSAFSASIVTESEKDDDDENPEIKARNEKLADLKEHIQAYRRQRGDRFAQAATMRTVDDFESDSEESEEDPDDELTSDSILHANTVQKEQANDSHGNFDEDSDDGSVAGNELRQPTSADALSPDNYGTHQLTEYSADMPNHFAGLSSGTQNGNQSQDELPRLLWPLQTHKSQTVNHKRQVKRAWSECTLSRRAKPRTALRVK